MSRKWDLVPMGVEKPPCLLVNFKPDEFPRRCPGKGSRKIGEWMRGKEV